MASVCPVVLIVTNAGDPESMSTNSTCASTTESCRVAPRRRHFYGAPSLRPPARLRPVASSGALTTDLVTSAAEAHGFGATQAGDEIRIALADDITLHVVCNDGD